LVNKGNPEYKSSTYTEPGGYVTLLTRAYQIGFYDSNLVYKIESEAILNKNFYFTKTDSLIIRRGDNSAFFDGIVPVGTSTVKDIKRDTTTVYDLDPIFSDGPGVKYNFKVVQSLGPGDTYFPQKTSVYGEYYFVATNTTDVQSVYFHNQRPFVDSISFSFGPVGVNIPISTGAAIYYATPMTLQGNIQPEIKSVLISSDSYEFEPQYFFYNKIKEHNVGDFVFSTNRLRTGFIEKKYLTLSAKRKDAGLAYLEYYFPVNVRTFGFSIGIWSEEEYLNTNSEIRLESMVNGEWTLKHSFNIALLSKSKDSLDYFNFDFSSYQVKNIRLSVSTNQVNNDKNKGRVVLGDVELTYNSYNFDPIYF